jgi:hypothetical protein
MKASSAAVNGALAVAGLIAAYVTWQRPKETTTNENVVVLDATKGTLGRVRFEDGTRVLEVYRPEGEKTVWLKQTVIPAKLSIVANERTLDAGLPDSGMVVTIVPTPPPPPREVRANDRADQLLLRFAPFEAVRALGTLAAEKQKELGLQGSERKLTITVSGQPHVYTVSSPQPGMIGTYLRDEKDQKVYLLTGSLLSELEPSSQALVERKLHSFRAPDFDEFVITNDGKKQAYLQKDAEIPQTMKVAAKETPDKADELVRNWSDKVWNRLIITEVLGKGEAPKDGEPKVELRIDYLARGSAKGWTELGKSKSGDIWARSENTAGWVGIHAGTDDVVAEAKKFLSR